MENDNSLMQTRKDYREAVNQMGKKEFTLLKMQEYGFWPEGLPTPYERQENETREDYKKRKELLNEYEKIAAKIAALYGDKDEINEKLHNLRKQYDQTWDYERIRKDVSQKIMRESVERRAERKKQKELKQKAVSAAWQKHNAENIVFIGKGYSGGLFDKKNDEEKLSSLGLPVISDDKALAAILGIEYRKLRFLTYHRDVVAIDHYHHYTIPKRSGGVRSIAAPKKTLKYAQRQVLELILEKVGISGSAHGFYKGRSVVSGADAHVKKPAWLINLDIENFFPTITFERVRGMFKSFGYSGYIASLLAMLCTYCERMPIEVRGQTKYVKTSERVLPQGSPASPMITNIICRRLDQRINELAAEHSFSYSRYADDMSFSFEQNIGRGRIREIIYRVQCIVSDEGFNINKKKTHYLRNSNRQCVTGIVINNEQLGVPKIWLKRMRAAIYNANKLKAPGGLPPQIKNEIAGMVSWLKSVNKDRYAKIIDDADRLLKDGC